MDNEPKWKIVRLYIARIRSTCIKKTTNLSVYWTRYSLSVKCLNSVAFWLFFFFGNCLENAATPYAATVSIKDMQYGVGYGTSKKQAKSEAARATLEILIPEMRSKITADSKSTSSSKKDHEQDLSVCIVCSNKRC